MARTITTDCPPVPKRKPDEPKRYTIEVITPLFGGGVESGVNDPITLIRPSSIRGHLRFWWRATRGAAFATVKEMRQREAEIWGSTKNPSPVRIEVSVNRSAMPRKCAAPNGQWDALFDHTRLPYALFPFQGDTEKSPDKFIESVEFELRVWIPPVTTMASLREGFNQQRNALKIPEIANRENGLQDDVGLDVQAAIWAWVNFGGVGARTRRGCGAMYCKDLAPHSPKQISAWFEKAKQDYKLSNHSTGLWPVLAAAPLIHGLSKPPLAAWNESIKLMYDFRQGSVGRNGFHRSYWPEADSLRALTGLGDASHKRSNTLVHPIIKEDVAFPRAQFGLPIVFHFKDGSRDNVNNCELYPLDCNRMASPLILRPLAMGKTTAVPMVLQLNTPEPENLELKHLAPIAISPALGRTNIARPDLATYPNSPMAGRTNTGSALEAFMAYAKQNGFL